MKEQYNRHLVFGPANMVGKFTLELRNEDGTLADERVMQNSVKSDLLQYWADGAETHYYPLSPFGGSINSDAEYAKLKTQRNLIAVSIYNDPTNTSSTGFLIDEGEIRGYFNLGTSNADSSNPVQGNRLVAEMESIRDVDAGTITNTLVGEFGSAQLNTTFNKIGFNVWGYNNWNYIKPNLYDYKSVTAWAPLNINKSLYTGPHSYIGLGIDCLGPINTADYGIFGTNDNTGNSSSAYQMSNCLRSNMTSCAGGEIFTVGIKSARDTNTNADIEIFHINGHNAQYTGTENGNMTPIYRAAPSGDFTLNPALGGMCTAYDPVGKVLYCIQVTAGTDINIWPLSWVSDSTWTLGTQFTLSLSGVSSLDGYPYVSATFNRSMDKLHIAWRDNSNVTQIARFTIDVGAGTGTVDRQVACTYTGLSNLAELAVLDDDKLFIAWSKKIDPTYVDHLLFAGSSSSTYPNGARFGVVFDCVELKHSPAMDISCGSDYVGDGNQNPYYYATSTNYTHGALHGGTAGVTSGHYGFITIDKYSLDLIKVVSQSNALSATNLITYGITPFTPSSTDNLISSQVFDPITKVQGQTLKVVYSMTYNDVRFKE